MPEGTESTGGSRVGVVVVAAGSGTRIGAGQPKAFLDVAGRPMLARALEPVNALRDPADVVVVAPASRVDEARRIAEAALGSDALGSAVGRRLAVVAGEDARQSSVARGLAALAALSPADRGAGDDVDVILVHDAARALTPSTVFDRVVDAVRRAGESVIPALPVADTIKRVDADRVVLETVDRSALAAIQTPQGFPRRVLEAAYASAEAEHTDDAALVAVGGHPVRVVDGDALAFKLTTPDDLARAEALLAPPVALPRIGIGTDTHRFDPDVPLVLALLAWPDEPGLAGHSDGDAVAHAVVDALLSAAGAGDIGGVFGTDDPALAGAAGSVFLARARSLVEEAGFRIGNVAVQVQGVRPRLGPRRAEAEAALSAVLGAPVSLAATTTDGLGAIGRGEGVTALATALVVPAPR